jgi:ArsR family transcriptional regulator
MVIDGDTLVQALADGTRLRALVLLTEQPSLCVCELTAALGVSQPKMSRHLAALRALDIVEEPVAEFAAEAALADGGGGCAR